MINTNMRLYNYFTLGSEDEYGQPQILDKNAVPEGQIKMTINITSQSVQDNVNYRDAEYVGLTYAAVTDKYIIQYGDEYLKVHYINPMGKMKQVFMQKQIYED